MSLPIPALPSSDLSLYSIARDFGFPAVVTILVLFQLTPKIDQGIAIADHVDAELQFLAARGCAPPPTASVFMPTRHNI